MIRKTPLIKLKNKPKKPTRRTILKDVDADNFDNLQEMIEYFECYNINFSDVKFKIDHNPYDDYTTIVFVYKEPESDKDFENRMKIYKRNLDKYNKWEEENRDLIEQEKNRREQRLLEKQRIEEEKYKTNLEKQLRKIERELRQLNG